QGVRRAGTDAGGAVGLTTRAAPRRSPGRRGRLGRCLTTALAATLAAAGACTEVNEAPDVPFSLALDPPGAPGVVFGDSLRDTLGVPVRLRAVAYNFEGEEIPDVPVTFTSLDTTVRIVDGYVVGRALGDTAQIVATVDAGGQTLQTQADRSIVVTLSPDTVGRADPSATYAIQTTGTDRLTSQPLAVRVFHRLAGPVRDTAIAAILVRYKIVEPDLPPTEAQVAYLVSSGTRRATSDTTDATGTAGVRVRIGPCGARASTGGVGTGCASAPPTSFKVRAFVTYKAGAAVLGSPVEFTVENPVFSTP
ncbi:MAG TPA: hypothetical protein VNA89_09250, partial [Gemmatimonadaceae bacterium]|nr:hypothetical protein [Gemmatimonadaceae bacterium]